MQHTPTVTIEEMNATIAEFAAEDFDYHTVYRYKQYLFNGLWIGVRKLKFHSDWNMLMQVCVKCESIAIWQNDEGYTIFHKAKIAASDFDLSATHLAVYQFAKWYLSQKENKTTQP